ncbi:fibroblast growth factor 22 isoform X2 [Microtus pennsylvanicus]|uniref:fibroblast growth factor 22 isoform X2 n=1 Tax=Microtus pennsylvanicus TaxID=10058 RepID=UPI003F6C4C5A
MRRRLWLGLAWLLLARAPGAPGGYPHLEGDVRWRRLFSSTHFFLRVDPGGRVEGTRWRHGQDSIVEIRSVHVGTVVIKAVYSGFYVAMNRRGRLYGSAARWDVAGTLSFKHQPEEAKTCAPDGRVEGNQRMASWLTAPGLEDRVDSSYQC